MQAELPPLVITSPTETPLNAIYDRLLKAGLIELDVIEEVEVTRGKSAITAHGDAPISRILLRFNGSIYTLHNHFELRKKLLEIVEGEGDAALDDAEILTFLKEIDEAKQPSH